MKYTFSLFALLCCVSFVANSQDATTLYQEGVKLKDEKRVSEAAAKFKKAIELKPDYTAALYELGWCRNDMKDYVGAINVLRQTQPAWSAIPKVFFEMGYAFEKIVNYDSAIFYYNKCQSIKSDYSGVPRQLGYIYYQKEDYNTAVENFIKYEGIVKTPITDYLYWYRKGFSLNALKRYSEAKPALLKSAESKADYVNTYLELGFAASRLKESDLAISYYNKAIELDPKSHVGYNGIGEVYRDYIKDMTQSMAWYQKALDINPKERKANFGMGYCLNSTGKYSEAVTYLKKAIEAEDTYTAAYVEIGYSYYMLLNNTDALINLNKAVSLNPQNENSRYYKCLIYISQKDRTNAQLMVDQLKGLNSKHVTTLQEKVNKM